MEVETNNSIDKNTSLEDQKVEENDCNKQTSLEEDILGAQSLLMSESDDEGVNNSENKRPLNKICNKRIKRILENDDINKDKQLENKINREDKSNTRDNIISSLIDSDSEQESLNGTERIDQGAALKDIVNSDEEISKIDSKELKHKIKKNQKVENLNNKSKSDLKRVKSVLTAPNKCGIMVTDKKKLNKLFLEDTESETEATSCSENVSESELAANAAENNNVEHKREKKKSKNIRASAKKAMDEMQAIQSEQQRLHREAQISIPYHKPKKHTLDEFLKRRTIIQPHFSASMVSPAVSMIQTKRPKMTAEELKDYAKLMEERAKEATEFFKSDSEQDSEDEVFEGNVGLLDEINSEIQEHHNLLLNETLDLSKEIKMRNDSVEENGVQLNSVPLTGSEADELLTDEIQISQAQLKENIIRERPTSSKVLITEILELPKLDMNAVRMSPIKNHTPPQSLNIKKLLEDKDISESPFLTGDPNKLIDLETGDLLERKPSGVENLMNRLISTVKARKSKASENCNILSIENGKLEMCKVTINSTESKDVQREPKPGAAYFELKKSLKDIIKKKRMEEMYKKQEDEPEYSKCLADNNDNDNNEDKIEHVEKGELVLKSKSKVIVMDDDENALVLEDNGEEKNGMAINSDEENSEVEYDEKNGENKGEKADENGREPTKISKRKSRVIKAFDDPDREDDNDDIDFLITQPHTPQPSVNVTQTSVKSSVRDEETELMTLYSGIFDATQRTSVNALMSQIPITQNNNDEYLNNEDLIRLCSGSFDQSAGTQQSTHFSEIMENPKTKCSTIFSSDEEVDGQENKQKVKKFVKKLGKNKVKLYEEEGCEEEEEELSEGEIPEIDDEELETFVDYDSEENEVLVHMTKRDKIRKAQNFVENEAELSDSEWCSADEDEKNLDTYDIELGDEDEFDREQLQTELGQIHARKMLDEDIREVRKIQEMFFEDEENNGVGRQRTFKWKNSESGFSLDDKQPLDEYDNGQQGDSDDEISEHQWRKIRYEREQFLKEKGLKTGSQNMCTVFRNSVIPTFNSINTAVTSTIGTKKLKVVTAKKTLITMPDSTRSSPFLISKGINKKSVRGSFLVRDNETLNKLASLTKYTASSISSSDVVDTAGTISIKSIKPKNFVFATLTEEEHENLKRKADDLLNSSNENGKNFMKKPKIEPRRDKCFIDQLL